MKKFMLMFFIGYLLLLSSVAFAGDKAFSFNLENTGTQFITYTGDYNTKSYSTHPAAVKLTYNNAQGGGYYIHLSYKNIFGAFFPATENKWFSGVVQQKLGYLSGQNIVNRNYYISARIDNDYPGPYAVTGLFNSDDSIG